MADFKGIAEGLIAGNANRVKELIQAAVDEGTEPQKILDQGLIAGMEVVGRRFKNCEIYVPEVLVSARAMHAGLDILEPLLAKSGAKSKGTFSFLATACDMATAAPLLMVPTMISTSSRKTSSLAKLSARSTLNFESRVVNSIFLPRTP